MSGSLRVAVVGTGRMGSAMVGRLVDAGHDVSVFNRTKSRAAALAEEHDIAVAPTAREAVSSADVVVVSLADDAAVRAAYLGADGLVAGLRAGTVVADTSTVDPATIHALGDDVARVGATLIDTPVSGSVSSVQSGKLLVMAGGDEAALARAQPVLDAFASRVISLGPLGSGATMKLVVNSMVHGLNAALAEALVLAEKAGVVRSAAYEVIASSAVAAPFVLYKRAAYENPDDTPVAFALDLVAKDLDLAATLAARVGADVPQLVTNRAVVQRAIDAGLGQADLSALAALFR
ncbi:MAG TPA: NAD(P)-dependent oxidoreductase [Jiangellaceae bacterium]|nr:NAD(P)-dependent oxidoreductase [Jiangellaceae bacterium]